MIAQSCRNCKVSHESQSQNVGIWEFPLQWCCTCVNIYMLTQQPNSMPLLWKLMQPHQLVHSNSWSHPIQVSTASLTAWPGNSLLATPSPLPSPLLLSTPFMKPLPKCKCTSSTFQDCPLSGKVSWTSAMQSEFGKDFLLQFTPHGTPQQMHLFVQKWIPSGVVPDQRTLSSLILNWEAAKVKDQLKMKLHRRLATFITDGCSVWRSSSLNHKKMTTRPNQTQSSLFCSCSCPHLLIVVVAVAKNSCLFRTNKSQFKPVVTGLQYILHVLTIASHHLGHTRYLANSQIVVHRVILCGYILQEEPYSKQCTKADLPMMIHCWDMMAMMWDFSCLSTFANPAQYGKISHPTISLHWQIGDGYRPPQTFNPFLQFSGLTMYKDGNLHCLGFEWPTTCVFSKLHPFSENTHSRHNTKHNIM